MQINSINNIISFSKRHHKKYITRTIPPSNVNPNPTTPPPPPPGASMGTINIKPRSKEEILAEKIERVQGSNLEIRKASDFYVKKAYKLQAEAQQRLVDANEMYEKIKSIKLFELDHRGNCYKVTSKKGRYYVESPRSVLSVNFQPKQCYEIDKKTGELISYRRDKSKQETMSETIFNFKNRELAMCEVGKYHDLTSERYIFDNDLLNSVELFVKGDETNYSATRKFNYYSDEKLKSYYRDYSRSFSESGMKQRAQYAYFYNLLRNTPVGFASSWQKDDVDLWSAKECITIYPDNSANWFSNFHKDGPIITRDEFQFIPSED